LFAAILVVLPPAHATDTVGTGPKEARHTIDQFHASLLDVMKKADHTSVADRYKVLEPEISQRFDLRLMIALATGKYWRQATKEARSRLADAFRRFSIATYATRFSGYSGQSFETLGVSTGPRKTELVSTEIKRPNDTPVALTYVTRVAPTGWRIVDVLVDDGISELAVRRSEYRSVLKSAGIEGLIKLLDKKTRALIGQ
jgi:phospholipid transport system substrate-binding protein